VKADLRRLPRHLREASGAAASRRHPGVIWTHNDSGAPVLYAIDASGREVGRVRVTGAEAVDWESVTAAPCPPASCLFIADIGDNKAARDHVTIYRIPEPALDVSDSEPAIRFDARYPGGPRNAEALVVLPPQRIYIITKGDTSAIEIYRMPEGVRPDAMATLERVQSALAGKVKPRDRVTGADATPDGDWVVVRTERVLAAYTARNFGTGVEPSWQMDLGFLDEPQGEGVAIDADGTIILTGEGRSGPSGTNAWLQCTFERQPASVPTR